MKHTLIASATGIMTSLCLSAGEIVESKTLEPALRDLEADRPDATESPRTVDSGHIQVESSVLGYTRDRSGGEKFEAWTWAETNIKYGLN